MSAEIDISAIINCCFCKCMGPGDSLSVGLLNRISSNGVLPNVISPNNIRLNADSLNDNLNFAEFQITDC